MPSDLKRHSRPVAIAAFVATASALAITAPLAGAQLHPGSYTLKTVDLNVSAQSSGGGYLACPTGQRIVSGGAYWHQPGQGPDASNPAGNSLGSSTPTTDGKGWYADGGTEGAQQLTITALCLPRSQVGKYTLKTVDLSSSDTAGGYLACPTGQRIVSGGAYWHAPGQGPDPSSVDDWIGSSTPTTDGKGWYADGFTDSARQLTITALCLPKQQIGTYTLKTVNLNTGADGGRAGGYLKCPKKQRIVSGGAYWHPPGQGPAPSSAGTDQMGSSTATTDGKGWYADGVGPPDLQLTITALCLPA